MNQTPSRRFTSSLSSGLSILAIFAFGYSISGNAQTVRTADHPTATKTAEEKSLDIPGTFKDLPAAKDAVTAKRPVVETKRTASQSSNVAQLTIDESKGVTARSPVRADVKRPAKSAPPAVIRSDTPDVAEATDAEFEDFHATAYCLQGRTASGMPYSLAHNWRTSRADFDTSATLKRQRMRTPRYAPSAWNRYRGRIRARTSFRVRGTRGSSNAVRPGAAIVLQQSLLLRQDYLRKAVRGPLAGSSVNLPRGWQ